MVELPLPGPHEDVLVGQLPEIDLRPGDLERHLRYRREVSHKEHREPLDRHLVDRAQGKPHPVGEGQVLVDECAGRQRSDVELAGREQHLAVLPVDHVAVVVHRNEVVVGADFLELPEGLQQRLPVPEPHVLDGRRVGADVGQGEIGFAVQIAGVDAVEPPRVPGGCDVIDEVRGFPGELGGGHDKLLDHRRKQRPSQQRRGKVSRHGPDAVAPQLPPNAGEDHHASGQ